MRASLGVVAAIALSIAPRMAQALEVEPVRVDFHAPLRCSDGQRFWAEVRARTARVRLARTDEDVRTFDVRLTRAGGKVLGELVILDPRSLTTHRTVSGESCDAVVSVLALVAALAVDPMASTGPIGADGAAPTGAGSSPKTATPAPAPIPAPAASSPAAAPASSPAPPPGPAPVPFPASSSPASAPATSPASPPDSLSPQATAETAVQPAVNPDTNTRPAASTREHAPASPARRRIAVGLNLAAFGAAAPNPIAEASIFADLTLGERPILAPSFRLAVHRTLDTSIGANGGNATIDWTYGRADICPLRYAFNGELDVRPCVLGDVGALAASGVAAHTQSVIRPWAAVGGLARFSWTIARVLRVELDGGLELPIIRETYFFQPTSYVYQAPLLAGMASLGVGVLFP
jgi:hypothetical protein